MDVVVVGSCVQDITSYTKRFPEPGESVRGSKFCFGFGGKGANQAVTAAKLGAKVVMVGKVGNDAFGPKIVENFINLGINKDHIYLTNEAETATAAIFVDEQGQNCIVIVPGANNLLTIEEVQKAEPEIAQAKVVNCQLEIPQECTLTALMLAKKHGVPTIFNPAPALQNVNPELFKYADIVCPNETEAAIITGHPVTCKDDAAAAIKWMLDKGAKHALVTLGEKGVVFQSAGSQKIQHFPAPKVKAVDTTGAGDAFAGALAFFLARFPNLSIAELIKRASAVAAHSVQFPGTQTSFPTAKELPHQLFEL